MEGIEECFRIKDLLNCFSEATDCIEIISCETLKVDFYVDENLKSSSIKFSSVSIHLNNKRFKRRLENFV